MFDNNKTKKIMTKTQLAITLILTLFISVTGATYAYYAIVLEDNTTINGEAATVNLTLSVEKVFPTATSTNTGVMVPQLSTSGSNNSPLSSALKQGCVDDNGNIVCQVYEIIIENVGGTATQVADGFIQFYSNANLTTDVNPTMPNLKWKVITSADATTPSNSVLGTNTDQVANASETNIFADDLVMPTDSSFTYYIIIWINEINVDQPLDPGHSFFGKITFNASNGWGVTSAFGDGI